MEDCNLTARRQAHTKRNLIAEMKAKTRAKARQQAAYVDPCALAYRIPAAIVFSGLSRSELYRRLSAGELVGRKSGRSLLVDGDSLRYCVANLPIAKFGAEKTANQPR